MDRLEDLNTLGMYHMQHRQHVAVLDYSLEKQVFDSHWGMANDLLHKSFVMNFPWAKDTNKKQKQRDIDELMAQWKERYGDPKDPEVQARFMRVAKKWKARGEESKKAMFADQRKLRTTLKKIMADRRDNPGKTRGK